MKIDNIDKFGNCVFCHRNLIKNVILNGKIQGLLDPDADTSFFKLTNGSILVVPICKPCKRDVNLIDPIVQSHIMESVNNGWELEFHHMKANKDKFPDHTELKEQELKEYYNTCIIERYEPNHIMR